MTDQQSHSSGSQAGTSGAFAHALGGARADVEQLLAAFLADPGGEAGQMTRTMLFNYMLRQQTQQDEQTLRELDEHKARWALLKEDAETMAVQGLNANNRQQELAEALREARVRQGQIGRYASEARKALAQKKPFNYERTLNQISAIVGLRGPEEFRIESEHEAEEPKDLDG